MRVLGIESSCDETAIALVRGADDSITVETNLVSSQIDIHRAFGGVVPEVAARRHVDVIFPMLTEAGVPHDGVGIDAVAVTAGPGLIAALRVGVELAKALAWAWRKPLVAANHLEGHLYSTWVRLEGDEGSEGMPEFPALALLVSGGHTELILMRGHGDYAPLGATRDDAAGEAFDKVAKQLGLPYPGGPEVSRAAREGKPDAIAFPRPMMDSGDLDFSFSGLKTAVAVYRAEHPETPIADVCASFEQAAVDVLVGKTLAAAARVHPASVILCGGVSANMRLRETLAASVAAHVPDATFHAPAPAFTGDNAAMIAAAGYFRVRAVGRRLTGGAGHLADPLTLRADPNLPLA